jgi:predicted Holliday junction resolvase-like endonuclease
MEANTLLTFPLPVILLIVLILYYFRGREIISIKSKEASLIQLTRGKEEKLNDEIKGLLRLIAQKEDSFSKEVRVIEEALLKAFRLKEEVIKKELELIQSKLNDSYSTIPLLANQQFNEFKEREISNLRNVLTESAKQSALADLENWKVQYEAFYRQDAINRSQSVILGKVTEHLVPFQQSFPYNPKEARFIGSPIDLIVFKGIETEENVEIHILEIKTGNSKLSKRQKLIRDAIDNHRVYWYELNV